jgi:hypothetical protein
LRTLSQAATKLVSRTLCGRRAPPITTDKVVNVYIVNALINHSNLAGARTAFVWRIRRGIVSGPSKPNQSFRNPDLGAALEGGEGGTLDEKGSTDAHFI